jgi:speckle-type POZ protein
MFKHPLEHSYPIHLATGKVRDDVQAPGHLIKGGSFTVECKINVLSCRDPNSVSSLPSSDLHQHLGELLQNQSGVDVTFIVSGESISAHKSILATRSPIFMAEFFGNMLEMSSEFGDLLAHERNRYRIFFSTNIKYYLSRIMERSI